MDKDFYLQYASVEDKHWWFVGRRQIIDSFIRQLHLPKNAEILEAGCATGGNLMMLSAHGRVDAMEIDETACELANKRQVTKVQNGSLPNNIPFKGKYDLILILDVLEHLDNDLAALTALHGRLKPGGWLLITVPAYKFLWSEHDEINHHKRRYDLKGLQEVVRKANYKLYYNSYFNTLLFPLIVLLRFLSKLLPLNRIAQTQGDLKMPSNVINRLLTLLFASECRLLHCMQFPFGVSILLLARKD